MKNKKTLTIMLFLLAVIALGIGYAAVTQTLKINGTATAKESATAFEVHFSNAAADATQITPTEQNNQKEVSSTASVTANNKVAQMAVTLTDVNDSQTCTFTVENTSQDGISAIIKPASVEIYSDSTLQTPFSSDYFDVETNITSNITIPSTTGSNTATFTVTVTLKQAYVDTSQEGNAPTHTENFYIKLDAESSQQS